MLSAIVPAAGSSIRMPLGNKLLLPWQGKSLLTTTLEAILASGTEEVIVVTGFEAEKVQEHIRHLPVRTVLNPHPEDGLTSSIQAGVRITGGQGYMICLADMVRIRPAEYALLKRRFETQLRDHPASICQPVFQGEKGNPVIFSAWFRQLILDHPEKEGCRGLLRAYPDAVFPVEMPTPSILRDIDGPEDYQTLLRES